VLVIVILLVLAGGAAIDYEHDYDQEHEGNETRALGFSDAVWYSSANEQRS